MVEELSLEEVTDIIPDVDDVDNVDNDIDGDLLEELFPGYKIVNDEIETGLEDREIRKNDSLDKAEEPIGVTNDFESVGFSFNDLVNYRDSKEYESLSLRDKRAMAKEYSKHLDALAESFFNESEKEKWDEDFRRLLVVFREEGYLEFINRRGKEERDVVFNVSRVRDEGHIHWKRIISHDQNRIAYEEKVDKNGRLRKVYREPAGAYAKMSKLLGPVYSGEDYKRVLRGEYVEPKNLFYLPDGDPLNIDDIRKEKFYLGLWETKNTFYPDEYPTGSDSTYGCSFDEAVTMALIYHPYYGKGSRNSEGVLEVNYKSGERKRISGDFFSSYGYNGRTRKTEGSVNTLHRSPREFFAHQCPNILEYGENNPDYLKPEDFVARSSSGTGNDGYFTNKRLIDKEPGPKGRVMVDGVAYLLGTEFYTGKNLSEKERYVVHKISPGFACIVKEKLWGKGKQYNITHIFRLLDEDGRSEYGAGEQYPRVNKSNLSDIGFWRVEDFVSENPEHEKVIDDWKEFLNFSNSIEKMGIGLVNFSLREQEKIKDLFSDRRNIDIKEFIGQENISVSGKENRLKAILTVAESTTDLKKVIEIGKNPNSQLLFDSLASITDTVSGYEKLVEEDGEYSDLELDNIRQVNNMVLRHASRLFLSASEVIEDKNVNIQDVLNILYRYDRDVQKWYQDQFSRKANLEYNKYLQLLNLFDQYEGKENMQTMLLSMIESFWSDDIREESRYNKNYSVDVLDRIVDFYKGNEELFNTSSETTGDVEKELSMLQEFFSKYVNLEGPVLDLGCGDRKRITEPMADMLVGKAKVIGIDIWSPGKNEKDNLDVIQGSIESIPLPDESIEVATLNWSPPNDWVNRNEQIRSFSEISRVLKTGGSVRFDIPYLEGGEGSWMDEATSQYKRGSGKFGDIKAVFPGGREGEFHIYPIAEFKAMLKSVGLGDIEINEWRTSSGKPRLIVTAVKQGRSNPISQIY